MNGGRDISAVDPSEIADVFNFHFIGLSEARSVRVGKDGIVNIRWKALQDNPSAIAYRGIKAGTLPMALYMQLNLSSIPRLSFW